MPVLRTIGTLVWVPMPAKKKAVVELRYSSSSNQIAILVFLDGAKNFSVSNRPVCERVQRDHCVLFDLI